MNFPRPSSIACTVSLDPSCFSSSLFHATLFFLPFDFSPLCFASSASSTFTCRFGASKGTVAGQLAKLLICRLFNRINERVGALLYPRPVIYGLWKLTETEPLYEGRLRVSPPGGFLPFAQTQHPSFPSSFHILPYAGRWSRWSLSCLINGDQR